jgi:hypothetical protein
MSRIAKEAKLVEVLLLYDGPQLLALKSERGFKMLAVSVKHEEMTHAFFTCEIREKTAEQYFAQKIDLNYAFEQAAGNTYYFFDFAQLKGKRVSLVKASLAQKLEDKYWPDPGFFASNHGNPFESEAAPTTTTRRYMIDGKWEAPDFSRFQGKMSEMYALFASINRFDESNGIVEKGYLSTEINQRFWKGGGSYGSFFDNLESRNVLVSRNPLRVDSIQYSSPGEIIFRGNDAALGDVEKVIGIFEENYAALKEQYRAIYGVLKKEKLLSARKSSGFSSGAIRDFVRNRSMYFAHEMALEKVDDLYDLCNSNVLVFAKVVLSIFRRAEAVYQFHAEGRVRSGE